MLHRWCLPVNFCEICQIVFFTEHLRVAAFEKNLISVISNPDILYSITSFKYLSFDNRS